MIHFGKGITDTAAETSAKTKIPTAPLASNPLLLIHIYVELCYEHRGAEKILPGLLN